MNEYYETNNSINSQDLNHTHTGHRNYYTWGELFYDWSDLLILPLMFIACIGFIYAIVYGWEYGWKWWHSRIYYTNDIGKCLNKIDMNTEHNSNVVVAAKVVDEDSKSLGNKINETWYAC